MLDVVILYKVIQLCQFIKPTWLEKLDLMIWDNCTLTWLLPACIHTQNTDQQGSQRLMTIEREREKERFFYPILMNHSL